MTKQWSYQFSSSTNRQIYLEMVPGIPRSSAMEMALELPQKYWKASLWKGRVVLKEDWYHPVSPTAIDLREVWFSKAEREGGHYSPGGTKFTSEKCPAGHNSPVNFVRGDIIHGGTVFTATPVYTKFEHLFTRQITFGSCAGISLRSRLGTTLIGPWQG